MGESLGGAMYCCAQSVTIQCPPGTVAHGAYKADPSGRIRVGDLYTGAEVCICIDLPLERPATCTMEGISLPSMDRFQTPIEEVVTERPNASILLTGLQIRISAVYRGLRETRGEWIRTAATEEVAAIRTELGAPEFDGHPIAEMLRQELSSLEAAVRRHAQGHDQTLHTELATHEQFVLLGRGTAQPIHMESPHRWGPVGHHVQVSGSDEEDENPVAPSLPLRARTSYLSPTASIRTRRVAEAMQTLSQTVVPLPDPDSD
jgi:hypothetical protein